MRRPDLTRYPGMSDKFQQLEKAERRQVLTATTEGQTVFTITNGSYVVGSETLRVTVGGITQPPDAYTETNSTTVTLSEGVPVGKKVMLEWLEGKLPVAFGHNTSHYSDGQDPIDVTKLKNYKAEVADKIGILQTYKTYKSVKEFGAISDCNYYNSANNNYYKDAAFTIAATDNTQAFSDAFSSGYNIIIDGDFLIKSTVTCNKKINVISNGGKVYMQSSSGANGIKHMFLVSSELTIEGVSFLSKNNQQLEMSLRDGGTWAVEQGYSSNICALNITSGNCTIRNCKGYEVEFLVHVDAPATSKVENISVESCRIEKTFIGIGFGNVINSRINNCYITMEPTLGAGTPHAIYFWGGCENNVVNNCYFYNNANIISLIRVRRNNANINVNNCTFVCEKTKSVIAVECTEGTNTVSLNGCKTIDCRGLFSNLKDGECNIFNCDFAFDNNIAANPISTYVSVLQNQGVSTLKVSNTQFNLRIYPASNAILFKNITFKNVSMFTDGSFVVNNDGYNKTYNSIFSSTGRFYIYGNGNFDMFNSTVLSVTSGETSYLTNIAKFYKCILSNALTNTNNLATLVDCTRI